MKQHKAKKCFLILLGFALFISSCNKKDEYTYKYKYQSIIDAMQGDWIINYASDEYLHFSIEDNIIHSENNTSLNLLFGTQSYEFMLVNEKLTYIIQEDRYVPYLYSVTDSTLFLEFGGGTVGAGNAPKTQYKFNKKNNK